MDMGRGGMWSQKVGKVFESHLEYCFQILKNRRICDIRKIPTPMVKNPKLRKYVYVKKSSVDFLGFVFDNSLHIAIEAKFTNTEKSTWYYYKRHQIKYLFDVWQAGGISLLIVRHVERILFYFPDLSWENKQSLKIDLGSPDKEVKYCDVVGELEKVILNYDL